MGKIQNKKVLQEMLTILSEKKVNTKNNLWQLLYLLEEEADAPAFFYDTNYLASLFKKPVPKMKVVFDKLKSEGHPVFRTHFSRTGFKTTAPHNEIKNLFQ